MPISGPKSIVSLYAGLRASGKGSTAMTVPTVRSVWKKASEELDTLLTDEFFVGGDDLADVVLGFSVGGDTAVFADGTSAGVVSGEGEDETFEIVTGLGDVFVEIASEEFYGAVEVLFGVVAIADAESFGGTGHELAESLGAGVAGGIGVETGFGKD